MLKFGHWKVVLLALGLATAGIAGASPGTAQEPVPLKVAVLDMQQIMRNSKAAQGMQAELEKQQTVYQAEILQKENALREADRQLASQRASLPQAEFQKKRQELEAQAVQLRKDVQARRQRLENLANSGRTQIWNTVVSIVGEIAKTRGISLVLHKSQVLLSANAFDITAETLKKLNSQLPTVKLVQQ